MCVRVRVCVHVSHNPLARPHVRHSLSLRFGPTGLDDGVAQLSIGERAKISIPASEAYGERGFPGL